MDLHAPLVEGVQNLLKIDLGPTATRDSSHSTPKGSRGAWIRNGIAPRGRHFVAIKSRLTPKKSLEGDVCMLGDGWCVLHSRRAW